MKNHKILIACEESGVLSAMFRLQGYEAYSCDLLPSRYNYPWHYQKDVFLVVQKHHWRLIIVHPPCTFLAVSGNAHYAKGKPGYQKRVKAISWTKRLWGCVKKHSDFAALENPVSVIFSNIVYDNLQWIQPWQFGHGETKKTGLALKGLPMLKHTNIVSGREQKVWRMPPSENRSRDRSVTYPGIASAMVNQWGVYVTSK